MPNSLEDDAVVRPDGGMASVSSLRQRMGIWSNTLFVWCLIMVFADIYYMSIGLIKTA